MRRHILTVGVLWILLTVILEVLVGVLPVPSPVGSTQALGEHQTVYMLFYVAMPFMAFVWVMLVYALVKFRRPAGDTADGPPLRDSTPILLIWAAVSFVTVIFLAGWGSFTLHEITQPKGGVGKPLHIQVVGQEWYWTYRYPAYGGAVSSVLYLPVNRPVVFDITSVDVVHSFWIYNLDVKEDAVPGVVNHAFVTARFPATSIANGQNWVVCNELCGLYHGYMRSRMEIVPQPAFNAWATKLESKERANGLLKNLPKYSPTYFPPPVFPPAPQDQST